MPEMTYRVFSGHQPTDAAQMALVPMVANTKKTVLQIVTAARSIDILEWWFEGNSVVANPPGQVEIIRMPNLTTPATITQFVLADISKISNPLAEDSQIDISSTTRSGFNAGGEGVMVNPAMLDDHLITPTAGQYFQFEGALERRIQANAQCRVRAMFSADVNILAGLGWGE